MATLTFLSAAILFIWSLSYILGSKSGVVGTVLHFFVAVEAGALCFPAANLPPSHGILAAFAGVVIYAELKKKYHSYDQKH